MRFSKCEFCQKCDFQSVNFVKNEIFKMWFLSQCWDFLDSFQTLCEYIPCLKLKVGFSILPAMNCGKQEPSPRLLLYRYMLIKASVLLTKKIMESQIFLCEVNLRKTFRLTSDNTSASRSSIFVRFVKNAFVSSVVNLWKPFLCELKV